VITDLNTVCWQSKRNDNVLKNNPWICRFVRSNIHKDWRPFCFTSFIHSVINLWTETNVRNPARNWWLLSWVRGLNKKESYFDFVLGCRLSTRIKGLIESQLETGGYFLGWRVFNKKESHCDSVIGWRVSTRIRGYSIGKRSLR